MAVGYRWLFGDLRTGKIVRTVDLTGGRWSLPFDGPGTMEGTFPLRSGEWPTARADAAVGKNFVAVAYVAADGTETFLEAGPLWTTKYARAAGELVVGGAGLWTYFDHRKLLPVLAGDQSAAEASLTYDGSLALIAKRLIEQAQAHTGGTLPIVLPDDADLGTGANTRTYPGYELGWVGERLKQLTEVEDGPEVQFVPRRRTDDPRFIEWVMVVGTEPTGGMVYRPGAPHLIDGAAPKSPLRDLTIAASGSAIAERVWAAGQGEAQGRPIVSVTDPSLLTLGYPLLEAEVSSTDSVEQDSTLVAHATELAAQSSRPVETWQVSLSRDGRPHVGLVRPGDWARFRIAGDVYVPDGEYQMRITAMSDDGDAVVLDLAPRLGDI